MSVNVLQSYEDAANILKVSYERYVQDGISSSALRSSGLVIEEAIPSNTGAENYRKERLSNDQLGSIVPEGGKGVSHQSQEGYSKKSTAKTLKDIIEVTMEMRDLSKNQNEVLRMITDFGSMPGRRMEFELNMYLSQGFNSSYVNSDGDTEDITVGDGLSVWNTAHTLTGSNITYRNIVPFNPSLSRPALELAEDVYIRNFYDNKGNLMGSAKLDTIVTTNSPRNVNIVREYIQSTSAVNPFPFVSAGGNTPAGSATINTPGTNQALMQTPGVGNVYQGRFRHVILPFLDHDPVNKGYTKNSAKTNYWILAQSNFSSFHLDIFKPVTFTNPSAGSSGEDIHTGNWVYRADGIYATSMVSSKNMIISRGDGQA